MPLETSALLLLLFYVLVVVEFFVPSGGLISFGAIAAAIAAVIVAWTHSWTAGFVVFMILALTTPVIFTFLVLIWPKTPMGKLLLIRKSDRQAANGTSKKTLRGTPLDDLVGVAGTAVTDLLPGGIVRVANEKIDAISSGIVINAGEPIVVKAVRGSRLVVKRATSVTSTPQSTDRSSEGGVQSAVQNEPTQSPSKSDVKTESDGSDDQFDLSGFQ